MQNRQKASASLTSNDGPKYFAHVLRGFFTPKTLPDTENLIPDGSRTKRVAQSKSKVQAIKHTMFPDGFKIGQNVLGRFLQSLNQFRDNFGPLKNMSGSWRRVLRVYLVKPERVQNVASTSLPFGYHLLHCSQND